MAGQECIHCGEDCGSYPVIWEGKAFCCDGCKAVYQIINENKLGHYYKMYDGPGVRIEEDDAVFGDKYAFLDTEEIASRFITFRQGKIVKAEFYIPVIHCSSCIWLLENLSRLNPAILQSSVHFVRKRLFVSFDESQISLRKLVELIASLHYAPDLSQNENEHDARVKAGRKLLYKIGVAGFAFANIMLMSLPDYLDTANDLSPEFRQMFSYMNLLLALPVFFYSASDYLLSAWKNLKHKVINIDMPVSLGMLALFSQSVFEIATATGTGYMDSLSGFVFFLLVGKWYQNKTYQALSFERDFKSYFPVAVSKINQDGTSENIPLEKVKPDDVILLRNKEIIPADGELLSDEASINYSFVSGESRPVRVQKGEEVFAGGRQIGNAIRVCIKKDVEQSRLTQLWNQKTTEGKEDGRLQNLTDQISKYFTMVIILIAIITAVVWYFIDPARAILNFTAVLIVACPCALALTLPFTFGNTMRFFGKAGFFLKKTDVVEKLYRSNAVVFDKTGTITKNEAFRVSFVGADLSAGKKQKIKTLSQQSVHPLSIAISRFLSEMPEQGTEGDPIDGMLTDYREITGRGLVGSIDGDEIRTGSAEFVDAGEESPESARVYVSINKNVLGYFRIENEYRPGLDQLVQYFKKLKWPVYVLSGDHDAERGALEKIFDADKLFFRQSPVQKRDFVRALQKESKVLMIGDGLNDAGALAESYVSVSIADNVFQFSPASDAILRSQEFGRLPAFINFTHISLNIVRLSFVISFMYNIAGLYFAVCGMLSPVIAAILMPLSSVSVVAFASLSTSVLKSRLYRK